RCTIYDVRCTIWKWRASPHDAVRPSSHWYIVHRTSYIVHRTSYIVDRRSYIVTRISDSNDSHLPRNRQPLPHPDHRPAAELVLANQARLWHAVALCDLADRLAGADHVHPRCATGGGACRVGRGAGDRELLAGAD